MTTTSLNTIPPAPQSSLKPILEASLRIRFTPCSTALFHYFLYQCLYFGADKAITGETIGYGHLAKSLSFSRSQIITGMKFLLRWNILLLGTYTKYGNTYLFNTDVLTWGISEIRTSAENHTSVENQHTSISENHTRGISENHTQQTRYTKHNNKHDKGTCQKKSKEFPEDSIENKLALYFKSKLLENNPKVKLPISFQEWCGCLNRMMRLDHHTESEIRAVIDFSQASSFWKANILSPEKLREKYDTLYLRSKEAKHGVNQGNYRQFPKPGEYTDPEELRAKSLGAGPGQHEGAVRAGEREEKSVTSQGKSWKVVNP